LNAAVVAELRDRAREAVDSGAIPSCQIAVSYQGEVLLEETFGAPSDSRYVVFSVTKPLVAGAVWQLLTEGALALDRTVASYVPEFATNGKELVTVEQVLLHTGGFPSAPLAPKLWNDRAGRLARFGDWRLNWPAGTRFEYHPTSGHWVLAELIERVTGEDFRKVVRERVIEPVGLKRFVLGAEPEDTADVQDVVNSGEPPDPDELERLIGIRELPAEVTNADALLAFNTADGRRAGVPGAGGISSAGDITLYYQALLHDPAGLWEPGMLADVTGNAVNHFVDPMTGDPVNRSRGLVIKGDDGKGDRRHDFGPTTSARTFGHSGMGGQIAWADPESGLSFCHLTNGLDRNPIGMARRSYALSKRAGDLRSAS
jgi:CubicO group peptidase (beta-lactamase class C family)